MLYYEAERICLHNRLMNDVVSGCSPQRWELTEAVSRPCVLSTWLLPGLCLCPFLRIEKQTLAKYLPAISGASARQPAAHKGRVLCAIVLMCASAVFGKVSGCQGVLRLFPSLLCQHCVHACVCTCVYVCVCVCVHQLCGGSWLKGRIQNTRFWTQQKAQGTNTTQHSTSSSVVLSYSPFMISLFFLAFCLCPSRSYCSGFPCVCVFITAK